MGDHPLFFFPSFIRNPHRRTTAATFIYLHADMTDHRNSCRLTDAMTLERDERPWGMYEVLAEGAGYKVKRIAVNPGQRLSLQSHEQRSEHWVIVSGTALATVGEEELRLVPNQHVIIPLRTRHRVANAGDETLVFIEVQSGAYLGEDDIQRFQDDYNRAESQ